MAKKVKAGAGARDTDGMKKSEIRAYHKEINEFFAEHGWRDTLSYYSLSPKQAKEITADTRAKRDKDEEKAKAKRRSERKKKSAKAKAPKKRGRPKKEKSADDAPEKAPKKRGRPKKSEAAKNEETKTPKKRGRPKKSETAKTKKTSKKRGRPAKAKMPAASADLAGTVLDFLLVYRKKEYMRVEPLSLDDVIIDLTIQVRAS